MAASKQFQFVFFGVASVSVMAAVWLISCGGNTSSNLPFGPTPSGTVTTSITDPPTCANAFDHVWVTVTKVTANLSATAGIGDPGWVSLVDSSQSPQQLDLLSLASATCAISSVGSTSGLAPGKYQQVRLYLLSNTSLTGPATNNCGSGNGFNCVVPHGGTAHELLLSNGLSNGLIISGNEFAGGGLTLTAGQPGNLSIIFNSCASIILQSNGQYRLKPALNAGAIDTSTNSISGKVIDGSTQALISGATVLLEQPDSNGIDRVVEAGLSLSDGTFVFCPLPSGNYDIVVDATAPGPGASTTVYGATVTFQVPAGTTLNKIPLASEGSGSGVATPWAQITGQVTSAGPDGATIADVRLLALQQATPVGGTPVLVTIPVFSSFAHPLIMTTVDTPASGPACPSGTDCFNYSLTVPSGNPTAGTFASGPVTYTPPASGNVNFTLSAESADCTASAPSPAQVGGITVSAAASTSVTTVPTFTGCSAPF